MRKIIGVWILFWTDELVSLQGNILPKHELTSGVVRLDSKKPHGIATENLVPINSLLSVGTNIGQVVLHLTSRMKMYLSVLLAISQLV